VWFGAPRAEPPGRLTRKARGFGIHRRGRRDVDACRLPQVPVVVEPGETSPMVRLVATDLDGTLLLDGPPLRISSRVRSALAAVQSAGIVVVLVTARNWRSVLDIASMAGVGGLAVCSNGAVVVDLATGDVHRSHPVAVDVIRAFVDRCRAAVADVCFGWETAAGAYRDEAYHRAAVATGLFSDAYNAAVEVTAAIADDHEVTKLLVRHESLGADALLELLAEVAGADLTATVSGGAFVEITGAGITKAHALALLCDDLGFDASEVVAVGDQPNDLPMLQWAGRGVAMGNAHPAVLAAIHERTATNAEDGLALVLESLVP
jgi:Cof subfamily protein (haloacid dehalogenase superfamily)